MLGKGAFSGKAANLTKIVSTDRIGAFSQEENGIVVSMLDLLKKIPQNSSCYRC